MKLTIPSARTYAQRLCQYGLFREREERGDQQRTKHIFSHSAHESKNFLDMTLRSSFFFSDGKVEL